MPSLSIVVLGAPAGAGAGVAPGEADGAAAFAGPGSGPVGDGVVVGSAAAIPPPTTPVATASALIAITFVSRPTSTRVTRPSTYSDRSELTSADACFPRRRRERNAGAHRRRDR